MIRWRMAGFAAFVAVLCTAPPAVAGAQQGQWSERAQVFFDSATGTVFRRTVRAWDIHPQKNLDFLWHPAAGTDVALGEDGAINGRGKLVWRVRGAASYDPAAVFATYQGMMARGRPHGRGRLVYRSGERFEGDWSNGVLDGTGMHVDEQGNRYEGEFRSGMRTGRGRLLLVNGEIYQGSFADGKRHGEGRTTLPGGTSYTSHWQHGREIGERPDMVADADAGGLLKVQTGQDAAARTAFAITVDERMNQRSEARYVHLMREEDIAIYPEAQEMNDAWNGTGEISEFGHSFTVVDWDNSPVFVEAELATTDKSRVRVDSMALEVADSLAYRKPMLAIQGHRGCVGFRPSFSFVNHGWGRAENATVSVRFTEQKSYAENPPPQKTTREFTGAIADFDEGVDVSLRAMLAEAGVDVDALETKRFSCPSIDSLAVCKSQVFNAVGFGELTDVVWGDRFLSTRAVGTVSYDWSDDRGNRQRAEEAFSVDVSLAVIEMDESTAECGDGFGGSPEALRYIDVELPVERQNYAIDIPMRGNRNLRSYTARLKMSAAMSSLHQFRAVARFADGSVRRSKPVSLFYFRPRQVDYLPTVQTPACYLSDDDLPSC